MMTVAAVVNALLLTAAVLLTEDKPNLPGVMGGSLLFGIYAVLSMWLDISFLGSPFGRLLVLVLSALVATAQPRLFVKPNEPLGEGKGIHPGRVAWVHNPGVATWDGETGLWVEGRWNDQQKADAMIRQTVMTVAGAKSPKAAWKALFKNFNKTHIIFCI